MVGAGLELAACGWGHRRIAERLRRPTSTVRGWLRCFSRRAVPVAAVFTSSLVALADDPSVVLLAPTASAVADAVAAVVGYATVTRSRFAVATAPIWRIAAVACHGWLLAPGWPPTRNR